MKALRLVLQGVFVFTALVAAGASASAGGWQRYSLRVELELPDKRPPFKSVVVDEGRPVSVEIGEYVIRLTPLSQREGGHEVLLIREQILRKQGFDLQELYQTQVVAALDQAAEFVQLDGERRSILKLRVTASRVL